MNSTAALVQDRIQRRKAKEDRIDQIRHDARFSKLAKELKEERRWVIDARERERMNQKIKDLKKNKFQMKSDDLVKLIC